MSCKYCFKTVKTSQLTTSTIRYTEPEVARRLLSSGFVMVGHAKVAVKEMDGQPAVFSN